MNLFEAILISFHESVLSVEVSKFTELLKLCCTHTARRASKMTPDLEHFFLSSSFSVWLLSLLLFSTSAPSYHSSPKGRCLLCSSPEEVE